MLKLTEHVRITIFLLYKQNTQWNSDIQNFNSEILIFKKNFYLFFAEKIEIFRSGMFLWRHNYVTHWPIVLILVCMDRGGPYLPIDTKGGGCNNPPWLDVLQKLAWLDEG